MRPVPRLALAFVTFASVACGGSAPPPRAASADADPPPAAAPTTTAAVAPKTTQLTRSQIRAMIRSGLGVFFQNVALDDYPVMRDGKFHGFKLEAMNPDWNIDLQPGDVILKVSGMPIEHPEEADAALRSLENAPALRIDYERGGKPAVFQLPIVDDGRPGAAPAAAAASTAAPSTPATARSAEPQGKRAR